MSKHLPQTGTIINDKFFVSGTRYLIEQKAHVVTMGTLSRFKIIRKIQIFYYSRFKK